MAIRSAEVVLGELEQAVKRNADFWTGKTEKAERASEGNRFIRE